MHKVGRSLNKSTNVFLSVGIDVFVPLCVWVLWGEGRACVLLLILYVFCFLLSCVSKSCMHFLMAVFCSCTRWHSNQSHSTGMRYYNSLAAFYGWGKCWASLWRSWNCISLIWVTNASLLYFFLCVFERWQTNFIFLAIYQKPSSSMQRICCCQLLISKFQMQSSQNVVPVIKD